MQRHEQIEYDVICPSRVLQMELTFPCRHRKLDESDVIKSPHLEGARLPSGWHMMLFPPRFTEQDLASDGYDSLWSPPAPFSRRMWASGSFEFELRNPLRIYDRVKQVTTLDSVDFRGSAMGPTVFVWLKKLIENQKGLAVREMRCLAYMLPKTEKFIARDGMKNREVSAGDIEQRVTPNAISLFRYSALTFNSHLIHYDHNYATKTEGWPSRFLNFGSKKTN